MTTASGRGRLATAGLVAAFAALAVGSARAGGSRDLADVWLVGPGDIGEAQDRAWQVGIGTGRMFGMPELAQWRLEGRLTRARWCAGLAWERLGADLYVEDGIRLHVGAGRRWAVGLEGGVDRLLIADDAPYSWPAVAVRATGAPAAGLRLELWCHLRSAPPWYGAGGLRRLAVLAGRRGEWAWAVALDRAVDGRPALQAEVLARVAPVACLGLRLDPWSGAVGLSTAWWVRFGWLRTSHLVHPELGTTHRWALVFGAGEGRSR